MPIVKKGKKKTAIRLVVYGVEGIGKSTLASQMPDPLWIDAEGSTRQMDVERLEYDREDAEPQTFAEVIECLDDVIKGNAECKTVVVDTGDAVEDMARTHLLQTNGKKSIEDFGYGKGYTMLEELWSNQLLRRFDALIAKGINVCLITHAALSTFSDPSGDSYSTWKLALTKNIEHVTKEWADAILFCNYKSIVSEDGKQKGKPKRMMYCTSSAGFSAKNRFNLNDSYELSITPLKPIFEGTVKRVDSKPTMIDLEHQTEGIIDADNLVEESPKQMIERKLKAAGLTVDNYNAYQAMRGGCDLETDSDEHIKKVLDNFELFVDTFKKWYAKENEK